MNGAQKILIVDDQIKIQEILADLLRNNFYSVEACSNGHEAKAVLKRQSFDLIITDLNMPYGDGYSLLQFLEKEKDPQHKDTNVMIITGGTASFNKEGLHDDVTKNYATLYKPFSKAEFLNAVATAMQRPKSAA